MVEFDQGDDFAKFIQGKYQRKMLRAQSVGFRALEFEERKDEKKGMHFTKTELLEISAVTVPMHAASIRRNLIGQAYFWLPLDLQKNLSMAGLHEHLERLKDGIDQALKATRDPEPSLDDADQWQEVLEELTRLTGAEGGIDDDAP